MELRERFIAEWKTSFPANEVVELPDFDFTSKETLQVTCERKRDELKLLKEQVRQKEFVLAYLEKMLNEQEKHQNELTKDCVESESRNLAESESSHVTRHAEKVSNIRFSLEDGLGKIALNTRASIPVDLATESETSKDKFYEYKSKFVKLRPAPKPPVDDTGRSDSDGDRSSDGEMAKTSDTFGKPISGPKWSVSKKVSHFSNLSSGSSKQPPEKPVKPPVPPRISSQLTHPNGHSSHPKTHSDDQQKSAPAYTMLTFSSGEPQVSARSHKTASQKENGAATDLSDKKTVSFDDHSDIGRCIDEFKEMKRQEMLNLNPSDPDTHANETGNIPNIHNLNTVDSISNVEKEVDDKEDEDDTMRRANGIRVSKKLENFVPGSKYALIDFSGKQGDVTVNESKPSVPFISKIHHVHKSKLRSKSAPDYENVPLTDLLTKSESNESEESSSDDNYEDVESKKLPALLETDLDSVCVDKRVKPVLQTDFEDDQEIYDNATEISEENDVTPTPGSQSSISSWTFVQSSNVSYDAGGRDSVFIHAGDHPITNEDTSDDGSHASKHSTKNEKRVVDDKPNREVYKVVEESAEDKERMRKLHMRQILVKGVLQSEKTYLQILEQITKIKRNLQRSIGKSDRLCSPEDITTIFYKIEEIYKQHQNFVDKLEDKVFNWHDDQQIGNIFKELVVFFPMVMEYVNNSVLARKSIHKCCEENSQFRDMAMRVEIYSSQYIGAGKETTSLEEILFKPVQRLQRNTLVLHDLLEHTPIDHPDYKVLKSALDLSDHNLRTFSSPDASEVIRSEDQRHLVKSGFVIEMDGKSRKLRLLFLFSDVIVCTKHKYHASRNKQKTLECKWFIPISRVSVESNTKGDQSYHCKDDIDSLKKKIVSLKSELRLELKQQKQESKERTWSISGRSTQRGIEKLQKKIEEQEGALILSSPHKPLQLICVDDNAHPHTILLSTDYEREEWRDAITKQQQQHSSDGSQLSIHVVQEMINQSANKLVPQVNQIGTALMGNRDEEMLSGSLNVTIHKLAGLDTECDIFCQLDLDSYGHFFMKARTHVCVQTTDPAWDEDFELDLDGSQTLRILLYKRTGTGDTLIGRSALELSQSWLKSSFQEQKISMNQISLTISIRHTPASKTLKRTPSRQQGGIFGVRIGAVVKREGKTLPMFVTACIREVENRGLQEVGIYRVSGVTSEIQRLKTIFNKNIRQGINQIAESDIHAVTGVLKLYFRELPEPLFTESQYKHFIATLELNDSDSKEKCMLQLLHELPNENYYTAVFMIEHLVKVGKYSSENKMSLSNLSTVFGPTLLHPAVRDSTGTSPAVMMMREAQDVLFQSGVLSFFLETVAKGKSVRRSSVE